MIVPDEIVEASLKCVVLPAQVSEYVYAATGVGLTVTTFFVMITGQVPELVVSVSVSDPGVSQNTLTVLVLVAPCIVPPKAVHA